jgi:tRNA(Ile)-lysidine synthase
VGPHPAVAAVRLGVRRSLARLEPGDLALAACSGGADSLALAAALAFEAPRAGLRGGAITVDHGLQVGSAAQAAVVAATARELGLDPVHSVRAEVATRPAHDARRADGGIGAYPGPEAAARHARYGAIGAVAAECGAAAVLLGHTLDDQAESVLLGLARGSGARSLAGMDEITGPYLRPLLGVRREQTRAACAAMGLQPWDDPQNSDQAYARTRVRQQILPLMEELLGPGIAEALARTAGLLRADADALDAIAKDVAVPEVAELDVAGPDVAGLDVAGLAALPAAIRTRVLRRAAIAAGAPAGALTAAHISELDAFVTRWHGQKWADLPGGVRCQRRYGRLHFTTGS